MVVITEKIRNDRIKKIKHCPCYHGTSGHGKRSTLRAVTRQRCACADNEDRRYIFVCLFFTLFRKLFYEHFRCFFLSGETYKIYFKKLPFVVARAPLQFVFLLLWMFLFLLWVTSNEFLSSCFGSRILHLQCYERFVLATCKTDQISFK